MSTTINDFRNFFRPDKQKEPFSLKKTIADTLSLVSASFSAHTIEIDTDASEDIWVEGYPNEYAQVLLNLLTNAKEAIQGRAVAPGKIRVRLRQEGELAYLSVADNGGGIDEAARERLFEPYFSTKEGGTGIGLYMSKMIIQNSMDGTIEARNLASGAEFTVICPVGGAAPGGRVPPRS